MARSENPVRQTAARILVVDEHPTVRLGLRHLLEAEPDLHVCCEAADMRGALELIRDDQPDLVILDLALRAGDGLTLTRRLRSTFPDLPILMHSLHSELLFAERALRAGASGYIMKSESPDQLIEAIEQVLGGGIYLSRRMRQSVLHKLTGLEPESATHGLDRLSDREMEVFHFLGQGYTIREIAETLGLSFKTVETHRTHIRQKLGMADHAQLVHHASRWTQDAAPT